MKKMLFIDRDGTIIKEPTDNFQVDRPEKLEFMPGVIGALREITGNTDFRWLRDCRFSYGRFYASANIDVEGVGK